MLEEQVAQLYVQLLEKAVRDEYRGHQDMHVMLDSIHEQVPLVGGEINVQKQDEDGNFYTQTYHVAVKDDMGHMLKGVGDIAGQCMKGEIVKKGFLFTCMECGEPFCRKHVKFVDNDVRKPLCRYGPRGRDGCYRRHWKQYTDGGIGVVQTMTKMAKAQAEFLQAQEEVVISTQRLKAVKKGKLLSVSESPALPAEERPALPSHGVYKVRCGECGNVISLDGVRCLNCGEVVDVGPDLSCPSCGTRIYQVECPYCNTTNEL